jgi:hypothetical protein
MVEFPFPTEGARRDIWQAVFPSAIDTSALDPAELTELGATGGTIQNIARRATFMAAAERSRVTMDHVRESARRDARQSGRELAEVESW